MGCSRLGSRWLEGEEEGEGAIKVQEKRGRSY